jgi:5-methyltetrahydrofolate--homocysteine methyltransferase
MPRSVEGRNIYLCSPEYMASYTKKFLASGVRLIGGCCGTTPEHIKAVVEACANLQPKKRNIKPAGSAASAYSSLPLDLDPKPLVVAEEMNTTTQKSSFRELVRGAKYDDILTVAKKLVAEGSHMLDLCCAIVGEDEKGYMNAILEKIATRVPAPISVDSTESDVIEEALKRIPGKPIINSINLEDGEKRTAKVLPMAKKYGAAVIALTIDEQGMALTADRKLAIAKRIYDMAVNRYGIRPCDLIFDALTLPISTGQDDYRTAGIETLEGVRRIKQELPECHTLLGVSNISFGLATYPRRVLNSVFMHEAVNNGLDMAIVNYSKIYPLYKIPDAEVEIARKLIFHDTSGGDPLQNYMAFFSGREKTEDTAPVHVEELSIEEKLKFCIVQGEKTIGDGTLKQSLEQLLEEALGTYTPLDLINNVLLDGMKTVGELFGARKMQLPSVLDSAGVMKQAVAYLEPKMEKVEGSQKGTLVLATVKGDVHDIGKNLVDIILSNNGYKVINLGIKQAADIIINAAQQHRVDAIGLSGLLVKSTLEMKYVIQDLERQGHKFPVICGGAALTRKYVEDDLRREYSSAVFYAGDAFDGLHVMEDLVSPNGRREARMTEGRQVKEFVRAAAASADAASTTEVSTERSAVVAPAPNVPVPPFYGVRVKKDFDLHEVFSYINETALFKNQWQLKTASQQDYGRLVEEKYRPILHDLQEEVIAAGWFEPRVVWGYFPCQSEGNDIIVYDPESLANTGIPISYGPSRDGKLQSQGFRHDDRGESVAQGFSPAVNRSFQVGALAPEVGAAVATEPSNSKLKLETETPKELLRFTFPRQREGRKLCISDFFSPVSSGQMDVLGLSLVTIGDRASKITQELFQSGEYTRYLYLHGLSVETAEALAELFHKHIRQELGMAADDSPRISDLFHQKYRGSRYSFGYPACPDLSDQTKLFALLHPEENIGVQLTAGFMLEPEQSTSAIIVHHPSAKYFVA